jgi:D-sedoheptulose 7-phosphate isomerase
MSETNAMTGVADIIHSAFSAGGKLLVCGNGGSAAQASHLVAELIGRYRLNRPGLPAVCLNTDPAVMTALANDFGYHEVFARQIDALGEEEDVLLVFTTSGRSPNILRALEAGMDRNMVLIAFVGETPIAGVSEAIQCLASGNTRSIQETHLRWIHDLCEYFEP